MWMPLEKEQCFADIASGKLNIDKDNIKVVNLEDDGYVDLLRNVEISAIRYLVESEDVKIYKEVIDTE